jgi:hypothetical protein
MLNKPFLNNVYYYGGFDEYPRDTPYIKLVLDEHTNSYNLGSVINGEFLYEHESFYSLGIHTKNVSNKELISYINDEFYLHLECDPEIKGFQLFPENYILTLFYIIKNIRMHDSEIPIYITNELYIRKNEDFDKSLVLNQISTYLLPLYYLWRD